MFIKLILLSSLFISTSVSAKDLDVTYGLFKYHIKYSPSEILMTGKALNLSMKEKPCNKKLILNFSNSIETMLKRMDKQKTAEKESLSIVYDKEQTYQSKITPAGRFFLSLPESMKKLKIMEDLECQTSGAP